MSGSFYSATTVTARKDHKCGDCGRAILEGERYERIAGAAYGDFWAWKSCAHCAALRRMIRDIDEESYYHEDGLNVPDWACDNSSPADIAWRLTGPTGIWDPIKALACYRTIRWFQGRWRDQNGQLREVPVIL